MIIKKYVGKTEAEAIETAKKELGNDVVVMNVKEVKPKGLFAFLRPKTIEVTVALEDDRDKFSPLRKENTSKANKEKKTSKVESTSSIEEKLENLQNLLVSKLQSEENIRTQQGFQDKNAEPE